jgi:hypothetical protein
MRTALFDLLPDFGEPRIKAAPEPVHVRRPQPAGVAEPPPVDIDALVAAAVADAEAALSARLEARHREEMEAQSRAEADRSEALMARLGREMGASVAAGIDEMEARLRSAIGDAVARILGGLLGDDLRTRSLAALAQTIGEALRDHDAARIRVSGPLSLFEPLKEALGPASANLDFTETPGIDLTVSVDDALIETRLFEWAAALTEVLS